MGDTFNLATSGNLHGNTPDPHFVDFHFDFRKSCKIDIETSEVRSVA
jgi:hypothetical protein